MDLTQLSRDQFLALMVAELDATLHERGVVRSVVWSDAAIRNEEAVELVGIDDVLEMVVEHTRIESYENQARDRAVAEKIFPHRFGPEIPDRWEAGYFRLSVEPGQIAKIPFKDRPRIAEVLTAWVAENLDRALQPPVPGAAVRVRGEHVEVPFRWVLWQAFPFELGDFIGPLARVVQISFTNSADLQGQRINRIGLALDRKLPKLLAAAGAHRRSILVLEERDSHLSSPADVSLALQAAAIGRQLPSVVYLVDTSRGDPRLLRLHEDGEWAHDGENRFTTHPFPVERASRFNILPSGWA